MFSSLPRETKKALPPRSFSAPRNRHVPVFPLDVHLARERIRGFRRQVHHQTFGVGVSRPRVLGVTPAAAHSATRQTDEKGTSACMDPLSLKGVKGLNNW